MIKCEIPEETLNKVFFTRSKGKKYYNMPDEKKEKMLEYFQKA